MSDDLRSRFESLDRLPVPESSVSDVQRRGGQIRRRRWALQSAATLAILATGLVAVYSLGRSSEPPPEPIGEPRRKLPAVDVVAQDVREDLGRLCRNFDFYFSSGGEPKEYRPVQCGKRLQSLHPLILERGPEVVIHAFADATAKDAWLSDHPAPLGGRFGGENWFVDVMQPHAFERVREQLSDAEVVAEPSSAWEPSQGHEVERLDPGFTPEVDLESASRTLKSGATKEILAAQLAAYSDESMEEPVPAWIITVRRCVPQYGGEHAAPGCRGDQLYVIVDATTGENIASFTN
jgi:hypothetical protein